MKVNSWLGSYTSDNVNDILGDQLHEKEHNMSPITSGLHLSPNDTSGGHS